MSEEQFETIDTTPETEPTPTQNPTPTTNQKATYQNFLELKKTGLTPEQTIQTLKTTAIDLFADALSQYPNEKEARKHGKEIAKELGCALSLQYKALKKIDKFKSQHTNEYHEATVKVTAPQEIPIDDSQTAPDTEQPPTINTQPTQPTTTQPIITQPIETEAQKAALSTIFKGTWNGMCGLLDANEADLTDAESDKLGELWLPTAQQRFPTIINNPEIIAVAGSAGIIIPKVRKIIEVRKKKAEEEKAKEQFSTEAPESTEPASTPASESTEQTTPSAPVEEKPTRAKALDRC